MPKGTKVHRCVDKIKRSGKGVNPYAVCQASTKQSFATGKKLSEGEATGEVPEKTGKKVGAALTKGAGTVRGATNIAGRIEKRFGKKAKEEYMAGITKGADPDEKLTSDSMIYTYKKMANYLLGEAVAAVAPVVRAVAKNPRAVKAIGAAGTGATRIATKALKAQKASDDDLEENKIKNPYVKKLMETNTENTETVDEGVKKVIGWIKGKLSGGGKKVKPKPEHRTPEGHEDLAKVFKQGEKEREK